MPLKGSFKLGPFAVDQAGGLSLEHPDVSPGFSIRWRGRVVHARLVQSDARDGRLVIESSLGRIPSTASNPATRAACFIVLRTLLTGLPLEWRVRLLPDHQPQLELDTNVALPISVTNLVTELTIFLLRLSPYLDAMDQAGFGTAAEAADPMPLVR
jgi:hypothetical protein